MLLVAILVAILARFWQEYGRPVAPESLAEGAHQVRRVVDGDTFVLDSGARIRLMGVDTPETVKPNHPVEPFGPRPRSLPKIFWPTAGCI